MPRLASILVVVLCAGIASADPEADADRAFHAALQAHDIDAFEQLAGGPQTRWTDDAWAEAARLAERAGDYERARRDWTHVIETGTDDALVRRARAALERLSARTGSGNWDAVARDHERLAQQIYGRGDPRPALEELEQLARANPAYPRLPSIWLSLAEIWEREGAADRALALLADAIAKLDATSDREPQPTGSARRDREQPSGSASRDREWLGLAYARIAIRHGDLDEADAMLAKLAAAPSADRAAIAQVRDKLAIAQHRAHIRLAMLVLLALLAMAAAIALRRAAGSWRSAGCALLRPPIEAVFFLPIGAVLVAVSRTGNPLVARALLAIVIAGAIVTWLSGVLLELQRTRGITARRAIAHAVLAVTAIGAATYVAVDRDRMLDLISETVEHGPAAR